MEGVRTMASKTCEEVEVEGQVVMVVLDFVVDEDGRCGGGSSRRGVY